MAGQAVVTAVLDPGRPKPPSTYRPGPAHQLVATPARGASPVCPPALSRRDVAVLRAAGEGRCALVAGAVQVDGRWCCDQHAATALVTAGLLAAAPAVGMRAAAVLTDAGRAALRATESHVAVLPAPRPAP